MFWSLTLREFFIKHAAFTRKEDRAKALVFTLAGMIGQFGKKDDYRKVKKIEKALRRYPVKPWLLPHGKTHPPD